MDLLLPKTKPISVEKNASTSKWKMIISSDVKNYIKFCSTLGLKQLIKVPTRITFNSFPLIDHTLTSSNEKVVQASIIETSLSDHQLIFCTRKTKRAKLNKHNYLTFCSMKIFSTGIFKKTLNKLTFSDYENSSCTNKAYSDVTSNFFNVVNKKAPTKTIRVKNNTNVRFDREIAEKIVTRDKLFRKF